MRYTKNIFVKSTNTCRLQEKWCASKPSESGPALLIWYYYKARKDKFGVQIMINHFFTAFHIYLKIFTIYQFVFTQKKIL